MDYDTLTAYGTAVKNLGGDRIGGYLVRYGSADDRDLYGDFFTEDTDFGARKDSPILWQHSMDPIIGDIELGDVELKKTDVGMWAEGVLRIRKEYEDYLTEEFGPDGPGKFLTAVKSFIDSGALGWSSGTAAHRVRRVPVVDEATGNVKAHRIIKWPLGLDASLTPSPAEPAATNTVVPLREFVPVRFFATRESEDVEAGPEDTLMSAPARERTLHLHVKWKPKTRK